MAKVRDIWNDIEVLDIIYIPVLKKSYPVYDKTETPTKALKMHDETQALNDFWILTPNFSYDVELIKN